MTLWRIDVLEMWLVYCIFDIKYDSYEKEFQERLNLLNFFQPLVIECNIVERTAFLIGHRSFPEHYNVMIVFPVAYKHPLCSAGRFSQASSKLLALNNKNWFESKYTEWLYNISSCGNWLEVAGNNKFNKKL